MQQNHDKKVFANKILQLDCTTDNLRIAFTTMLQSKAKHKRYHASSTRLFCHRPLRAKYEIIVYPQLTFNEFKPSAAKHHEAITRRGYCDFNKIIDIR